jgi:hypothetical protein
MAPAHRNGSSEMSHYHVYNRLAPSFFLRTTARLQRFRDDQCPGGAVKEAM